MTNIRNRVTIPVNFTARKSIKSEVAKAIYNREDSILAKIDRHEKTAMNLITEANLTLNRYRYKSQRKAFAELIQKNLDGLPLSSPNATLKVDLIETSNKQDWKCVFIKQLDKPAAKSNSLPIINKDAQFRDYLVDLIVDTV